MFHETRFVLPPEQEVYYRCRDPGYRPLPPYRADCAGTSAEASARGLLDFLYPDDGTRIYMPVELGGRKGRAVFAAVHRDPDARLHWHLDDRYIGSTRVFQRAGGECRRGAACGHGGGRDEEPGPAVV